MTVSFLRFVRATLLFLVGGATACSVGAPAEAIRPDAPTYADTVEGKAMPSERPSVLVVDWEPEARGALEVAMKQGVAVVAFDEAGLRLLDCHMAGSYGFLGMTRKERVVRLENRDEIVANLPFSGVGLAAELEGKMERGTTLDVALVMVGKRMSTARRAFRDQLEGACDGATHIVRGATVGAFVLTTGARAEVANAAKLFGAGARTASGSRRSVRTTEGDFASCEAADPDGDAPPKQCGSPLRIDLAPIVPGASASKALEAPEPVAEAIGETCPEGLVLRDGKCARPQPGEGHRCDWRDAKACAAQCELADPGSCLYLGFAYERGIGVAIDPARALAAYRRACDLESKDGCNAVAYFFMQGLGVPKDEAKAVRYYRQACDAGEAPACNNLGVAYAKGLGVSADIARAVDLYRRSCEGGHPRGCISLGQAYERGDGLTADPERAADLYQRACLGEHPAGCANLAAMFDAGRGRPKDGAKVQALLLKSCRYQGYPACVDLGVRFDRGVGAPQDSKRAAELFTKACEVNEVRGCANLGLLYLEGRGVPRDEARAAALFARTCGESSLGCDTLGELYAKGLGVPRDEERARRILDEACGKGDDRSCRMKERLGL